MMEVEAFNLKMEEIIMKWGGGGISKSGGNKISKKKFTQGQNFFIFIRYFSLPE
jgi:hypothetical protein